jgi:CheY-like chemotaxis protein
MENNNMPVNERSTPRALKGSDTILLVEDEDAVRKLAGTFLRGHGYCVLEAEGGMEALRICRSHAGDIHLLLADVVLPRISGPSVAERMMDFKPGARVLFMSGYTEESSLLQSIHARDAAFIPKPFTPEDLAAKVREVLDAPGAAPPAAKT